jgi:hypothetical protein
VVSLPSSVSSALYTFQLCSESCHYRVLLLSLVVCVLSGSVWCYYSSGASVWLGFHYVFSYFLCYQPFLILCL